MLRQKGMFMGSEVHLAAAEADSFGFEARTLQARVFGGQLDCAARAHHAMPRQAITMQVQHARHHANMTRIARGRGHLTVTGHFAARYALDGFPDGVHNVFSPICSSGPLFPRGSGFVESMRLRAPSN